MKRYLVPIIAGVTVFGAATAFAASLSVSSTTLGSGNDAVASCNATATVAYTLDAGATYSASGPYGYKVAVTPIASAAACGLMNYKLTLTGAANASLGEETGTLTAAGGATPDFTGDNVDASLVTGASLVISG